MIEFKRVFDSVFVKEASGGKRFAQLASRLFGGGGTGTGSLASHTANTAMRSSGAAMAPAKALSPRELRQFKKLEIREKYRNEASPMREVNRDTANEFRASNPLTRQDPKHMGFSQEAMDARRLAQKQLDESLYYQGRGTGTTYAPQSPKPLPGAESVYAPVQNVPVNPKANSAALQAKLKANQARLAAQNPNWQTTPGAAPAAPTTTTPATTVTKTTEEAADPGFFGTHWNNARSVWDAGMKRYPAEGIGGFARGFGNEFANNPVRNSLYAGGGLYGAGVGKDYIDAMTGSDEYDYDLWDKIKMGIGMEKAPHRLFDPMLPFFMRGYHAN